MATQKASGPGRPKFGAESAAMNKTVLQVNQEKGKVEKMDTSGPQSGGAPVTQSQTPKENVERISEHIWRAHHHMHRFADIGFPHPDGEASDEEKEGDDSQQDILALLWTHHECFDPKSLSRAQAEYNFYRLLAKQWRRTLRRVKMDDIKCPPFSMKDFRGIPRNRPLYAAICTILDNSKDDNVKKAAAKAAEEYHKLTVLEQHMVSQKMMATIPQGIDIEQGQYREIVSEMKSRFLKAASKPLRPIDKFKMLPLFEYLKLKETITSQRNQIEDLASRLSGIASQQLADGDPGFTDLGDKNRPQKLGERFAELFDETWSSAYESLKPKDIDDDESDEGTMDTLQQIVKVIYDFCQEISQDQIQRLIKEMIPPVVDPTCDNPKSEGYPASEQMRAKTEQMAREYRKLVAPATVKVMQTEIFENHIKEKLLKGDKISKELISYVEQCVDLIWYMCIQQPPMEIRWAVKGEKFNKEQFRFSGRKGKKYRMTVWPAVFLHKEGPLVAPGYAVPDK
ncbi:uncharacterized protein LOC127715520 isoform X2 [Mytilus californianus]|uniref:uncharacterized protein LOC127715520 isoform X2 n=1 Tax=Mytilus californianus TaxID=6549 RepID=UPI00224502FB|nr:uncharacterized protein LOC127715520 isoform X2 [Mytilus californianus]XP_052077541.1 uncharacterized protein LOC127715520 isoform X2 [Mytilus californianus]